MGRAGMPKVEDRVSFAVKPKNHYARNDGSPPGRQMSELGRL